MKSAQKENFNQLTGFAPTRIKVLSVGSAGSGKSCLIKRYCEERFVPKYIATIGVDYGVKPIKFDHIGEFRVNFWDLSGHPDFFEVRNEFYKDTQGCLLVYDVTSRESFEQCESWLAEAKKYGANPNEIPIALCANKADRTKDMVVSEDEGKKWAKSKGMTYFETSALSGINVHEMFDFLFKEILRKNDIQ
jgi:DnaJ homolog subfamily C member 27